MNNRCVCYYCGLPATGLDHVVPRAVLKALEDVSIEISSYRVLVVPCCKECNTLLEASYQDSLLQRKRLLRQRLRRKYRKVLASKIWLTEEILGLDYNLRSHIAECSEKRALVQARLKWVDTKLERKSRRVNV